MPSGAVLLEEFADASTSIDLILNSAPSVGSNQSNQQSEAREVLVSPTISLREVPTDNNNLLESACCDHTTPLDDQRPVIPLERDEFSHNVSVEIDHTTGVHYSETN